MWWTCPHCQSKVDYAKHMSYVFDETGESEFEPEYGLMFHTIFCDNCRASWTTSISGVYPKITQ